MTGEIKHCDHIVGLVTYLDGDDGWTAKFLRQSRYEDFGMVDEPFTFCPLCGARINDEEGKAS